MANLSCSERFEEAGTCLLMNCVCLVSAVAILINQDETVDKIIDYLDNMIESKK